MQLQCRFGGIYILLQWLTMVFSKKFINKTLLTDFETLMRLSGGEITE